MGQSTGSMQGPDLSTLVVPKLGQMAANIMDEIFQNHFINISALTQEQLVVRLLVPLKNIMILLALQQTHFFKRLKLAITTLKEPMTIPKLHAELNALYFGIGKVQVELLNFDESAWSLFQKSQLWYTDTSASVSFKPQVKMNPLIGVE